jgi:hypothetical protein
MKNGITIPIAIFVPVERLFEFKWGPDVDVAAVLVGTMLVVYIDGLAGCVVIVLLLDVEAASKAADANLTASDACAHTGTPFADTVIGVVPDITSVEVSVVDDQAPSVSKLGLKYTIVEEGKSFEPHLRS